MKWAIERSWYPGISHLETMMPRATQEAPLPANVHGIRRQQAANLLDTRIEGRASRPKLQARRYDPQPRQRLPAPEPGWLNIAFFIRRSKDTQNTCYAPCSIAELSAKGYQYWALGHVHEFRNLLMIPGSFFPETFKGATFVRPAAWCGHGDRR